MTKFINPNLDEALLSHELEFIADSPADEFTQYLLDNNEQEDSLIHQFDSSVTKLASNVAADNDTIQKKRSILEDLLHHASMSGLTIELTFDDIPTLEEEDLDLLILQFTSSVDFDSEDDI